MNLRKVSLYILFLAVGFVSCKKDDDPEEVVIVIEDREEQQAKDMIALNAYLDTHYYNASDINALLPNAKLSDIIIIKVEGGGTVPAGYTKLKDAVGAPKVTKYADVDYEYFELKLNQGIGEDTPTIADNIQVLYEGFTLDNAIFDYRYYLDNNLLDLSSLVPGWRRVLPNYNTAETPVENEDGTLSYANSGLGIMFIPSGLAYFSESRTGIPAYSPLVFKFELFQMYENDHDGDGIPSYLEDVDVDGDFFDNTDEDITSDNFGNIFPIYNYLDTDDDGDGKLTKDEIVISKVTETTLEAVKSIPLAYNQVLLNKINKEPNGDYTGTIITFTDTDGVKPFNYLDKNN